MNERLAGCQSTNHEKCNISDGLYECQKCNRTMCQKDGGADGEYRDYCDDCWLEATNNGEEEDVWAVRIFQKGGSISDKGADDTGMNYLDGVLIAMHIANEELGYGGNHGGDCDGFIEHLLGAIGEEELVARAEEMGQMELSGLRKYFSGVRDES